MSPERNLNAHLLTVLVEDYFHVGAFDSLIQQRNWSNFEARYEQNTQKALDLLDEYDTKATFFVLGWIAEKNPSLVREITERGHEVASRGYYHRGLVNLSREEFQADLSRTNRAIEDATGERVYGYRAAEKLNFRRDQWVLDTLAEEGMAYDASFMPTRKDEVSRRTASVFETPSGPIWEFPYSTLDVLAGLAPISGGNYIRQIPYSITKHAIAKWDKSAKGPFMLYFHVWELDPDQPRISAASLHTRLRHYRKLDKMEWVLRDLLKRYDFIPVERHLGLERAAAENIRTPEPTALSMAVEKDRNTSDQRERTPVTIVVPCFNEQETLPYLAKTLAGVESELESLYYSMRLIFVDDKSTDATVETIRSLFGENENATLIEHPENKGVAGAILTGLRAAQTDIVCSIDCDCTFDPFELPKMIPMLTEGVDMVTASPYHKDGGVRNVPGWRLALSKGASLIYRRILNSKLDSYTACFRVYRRSAMTELAIQETGYHGVAEMLGQLDLNGGKIVEFPTVLEVRLFGASKMKTLSTIGGHLKLMTRLLKKRIVEPKARSTEPAKRSPESGQSL